MTNVSSLPVIVDFDNIDAAHRNQGPVNLARMLLGVLPANLLYPYDTVAVRLYGGWRSATGLTPLAQDLAAVIAIDSPTAFNVTQLGLNKNLRVVVTLANGPSGTRKVFPETLAKNRPLRHFRAQKDPWRDCANHTSCGMALLHSGHNASKCSNKGCFVQIGDVLVRDEQKMVDTLMVADIAHETFVSKSADIIVVSSDADIWPGIFLALQNGRRITQLHPTAGWRTSPKLLEMLDHATLAGYREFSVRGLS